MAKRNVGQVDEEAAEALAEDALSVYIGPTIQGVIQCGAIYRGTVADVLVNNPALRIALRRVPEIAGCVVPAEGLTESRKALKRKGTDLYKKNRAIRAAARGARKS